MPDGETKTESLSANREPLTGWALPEGGASRPGALHAENVGLPFLGSGPGRESQKVK